ncbi:hypothetical protein HUN13_18095, partial [Acinetobacter seifertii]|uniref:hypothetical protein n=1 Tax=Acinetobacter seifertii TaxID=1530123 RepID=UPI0015806021
VRLKPIVDKLKQSGLNYNIGKATAAEANRLGMMWVGDDAKPTGYGWISADGTRGYRPPTTKQNSKFASTGIQANFETFEINSSGKSIKVGNAHLDIIK